MTSISITDGALLALVTLIASVTQAATGFGFAVVAVPLFLLILDSLAAIQLTVIVTLAISLALLPRLLGTAPRPLVLRLIAGSAIGFPIGMIAYLYASIVTIKLAVGIVIMAFAIRLLVQRRPDPKPVGSGEPVNPRSDLGVGVISGAMAVCLAMPGPAVLISLSSRGFEKATLRATTLTLFTFSYGGALALQATVSEIAVETWITAGALLPVVLVGTAIGHFASRMVNQELFRMIVLILLIAAGLNVITAALLS